MIEKRINSTLAEALGVAIYTSQQLQQLHT
jgi:hypothetical protein